MKTPWILLIGALTLLACGDGQPWLSGASEPSSGGGGAGGAAVGVGAGGTTAASPTLMTWNLELFPLSSLTESKVIDIVGELRPDVIAVQEIDELAAFEQLVGALDGYSGVLNDDAGGFLRVGFLTRDSVSISEVETLFKGDWYAFPRPPLKARISYDAFDITVVVVHLKAKLDQESTDRRRAACEALDDWIKEQTDQDIVIAGDFNDELGDSPNWNVFGPLLDRRAYRFVTQPVEEQGGFTYIPFESFIDHVLLTASALDEYGTGTTEVVPLDDSVASYENTVSDHLPVMVRFQP